MVELDEQLRAYGSALDSLIDGERTDASEPTRTGLGRVAAIGLAAACVVGVAVMAVTRESSGTGTAASPASTVPTDPAPPTTAAPTVASSVDPTSDWPASSVDACLRDTATYPADFGAPPTVDDPTELIALDDGSGLVRVTVTGTEVTVACTVSREGDRLVVADVSVGLTRPERPVDSDGVVVDDQSWMSNTAEGDTGPGWYEVSGRVGSEVTGVSIVLPDGSTAAVSLSEGNFYGRIDVASGVALFDEVLVWTLTDGSTRSSRSDLANEVSTEEVCASTDGCVEERIAQLRSKASGVVADVLADGDVTEDEYRAALQRVADCANAAGGQVEVIGSTLSVGGDTPSSVLDPCQAEHVAAIGEARALLDAQDRLAAG